MKTNSCLLLILFISITNQLAPTRAHAQPQAYANELQVTASQYCDFLNCTALTDSTHLYDQAMGTDPDAACIVRLGEPGKYFYEVIAGRENFPVTYMIFLMKNFTPIACKKFYLLSPLKAQNFH